MHNFFYLALDFSQVNMPNPDEWIETNFTDFLWPNFLKFLAAYAGVSVFRSLVFRR